MTVLKLVENEDRKVAEDAVNKTIEEYEKQGYDTQVLNLTPLTPQEKVRWRFVLLFTRETVEWMEGPPVADKQ